MRRQPSLWVLRIGRVLPDTGEIVDEKQISFTGSISEVGCFIRGLQEEGRFVLEKRKY